MVVEADEKRRRGEKRPDPPPPSAPGAKKRQDHAPTPSHRPLAAAAASEPTAAEPALRPPKTGAAMAQQPNPQFMLYSTMPPAQGAASQSPLSQSPQKSQGPGMMMQQPQHPQAHPSQLQPPVQGQGHMQAQQMPLQAQVQGRASIQQGQMPPQQPQPPLHHPMAHPTPPQTMSPRMPSLRNPMQPYGYAGEREREQPGAVPVSQPMRVSQTPGGMPVSDPMQQRPVTTSAPPMGHQVDTHARMMDQRQSVHLKQEPDMPPQSPYDYAGHPGARGLQTRPEAGQLPGSRPRTPLATEPMPRVGGSRNRVDRIMSDVHSPASPMHAPRPLPATPLDRFGVPPSQPAGATPAPPPAPATPAPAPKPTEHKKSSLMALLNDDPPPPPPPPAPSATPQREAFTLAPTPQPQGMAARPPPPQPQSGPPLRRETEQAGYPYARNAPGPSSGMQALGNYASPQLQPMSGQRPSISQQHEAAAAAGAAEREYYRQHAFAAQHPAGTVGSPQTGPHHVPPHSQAPQYQPQPPYAQYPPQPPRPSGASPPPPQYAMHMQTGARPREGPPREWTPAPQPLVPQSPAPASAGLQQPGWAVTQGPPMPPVTTQAPPQQMAWAAQPHPGGAAWSQQHGMPLRDERVQQGMYARPQHGIPPQAAQGRMQGQYPPTPSRESMPPYQHYGSPTTQVVHDPREMQGRSYTPVAGYDGRPAPPGHGHSGSVGSVGHMGHVHGYMQDPRDMQGMDPRERERRGN